MSTLNTLTNLITKLSFRNIVNSNFLALNTDKAERSDVQYASKGIFNGYVTNTQTGIVSGVSMLPTTGIGSKNLPADFFGTQGKALRFRINGYYSTDAVPGNATIAFKLGSTTIATTGSFAMDASITNGAFWMEGILTCRTTGASGTVSMTSAWVHSQNSATNTLHLEPLIVTSPVTVDLTASQLVDVLLTTTDAGTSFNTTCCALWEEFDAI